MVELTEDIMVEIKKGNKMKLLISLFVILLSILACAQTPDMPSGYTDYLRLRLYALDDFPGPDSLNQNLIDIDTFADETYLTLLLHQSKLLALLNWSDNTLKNSIIEYDDFNVTLKTKLATKDLTEIWTGTKTFNANITYFKSIYPSQTGTYNLGTNADTWKRGYFDNLMVGTLIFRDPGNPNDTTLVNWTTDGGITFSGKLSADTLSGLSSVTFYQSGDIITNVNDSVLTVVKCNSLQILLPGADMPKLEKIIMTDLPSGSIAHDLYIWINPAQDYNILFKDMDSVGSSDGNLQLNGDFDMDAGDMLHLQWLSDYPNTWIEVGRSNNR